jgi:aspartate carbamoyltransferase catalytic subunit
MIRHLLSTRDLSRSNAIGLLDTAEDMAALGARENKKLPALRGKTIVNLFYEDSTRTRISFEVAQKRLSADVINFSAKGSSVSKGESFKDTILTLRELGVDGVVIRHPSSGAPQLLAERDWIDVPVVNAGDGTHEHPTQALLDAFTLRRNLSGNDSRGRGLDGAHVVIVGDIFHSRVARSNVWLLELLGARVTVVAPVTLIPRGAEHWPIAISHDIDEVLRSDPDAVMMLRVQNERMREAFFPNAHEYAQGWGLTEERFERLSPRTLIMHPGPMNRGLEICSAAADSSHSVILQQVANGVFVRMAVLYSILTGTSEVPHE